MAFTRHPLSGETVKSADMARHLRRMGSQRARWIEGFDRTGESSPVTIEDGFAFIDGRLVGTGASGEATETATLTSSSTNHVFLRNDGELEVNTSGADPAVPAVKLWEFDTDGSNNVTEARSRRAANQRVRYDAPLEADTIEAKQSGENILGHRGKLTGSGPRWDFHQTDGTATRTRLVAEGGELKVQKVNPDTGAVIETVQNLRAPSTTITGDNLEWEGTAATQQAERVARKGTASGYAGLDASALIPANQTREASETTRGAIRLSDIVGATLGTAAKGTSVRAARADHVHDHGDRSGEAGTKHAMGQISGVITDAQHGSRGGGSAHSVATTSAHGFLSSTDKTALNNRLPTQAEKDALAGNAGTPSGTNKYVTETGQTFDNTSGTITDSQHGSRGGGSQHALATGAAHGFMSSTDKAAHDARLPSTGEKAALAGTQGTPSGTNKYVTADDPVSAATVNRPVRRDASGRAKFADSAANGDALTHGRSAGGDLSGSYPSPSIASDAVTEAKLAANAVTAGKIASNAVETAKINDSAVTTAKLNDGVLSADVAGRAKMADSFITSAKLGSGVVTDAKVAAANKDGAAGTPSMRTLGTGSAQAAAGNDSRFPTSGQKDALAGTSGTPSDTNRYVTDSDARNTNARTPTGSAGGDLTGSYPNPTIGADKVTTAKILDDNVTNAKLANMAAQTVKARGSGTGDPQDIAIGADRVLGRDGSGNAGSVQVTDEALKSGVATAATANTLVKRDASGRYRAADPSHEMDVVNKRTLDAGVWQTSGLQALTGPDTSEVVKTFTEEECERGVEIIFQFHREGGGTGHTNSITIHDGDENTPSIIGASTSGTGRGWAQIARGLMMGHTNLNANPVSSGKRRENNGVTVKANTGNQTADIVYEVAWRIAP